METCRFNFPESTIFNCRPHQLFIVFDLGFLVFFLFYVKRLEFTFSHRALLRNNSHAHCVDDILLLMRTLRIWRLITLSNCSSIFLDDIFNTCNLKELQVCLYWREYIYIYILLEFTFSHSALLRNNMYVDLGYLIFSFRTLMFWLAILYHVGHCYVMTTRQPYFNRDYKITFCKCELWLPKSRVSTTVCKTRKGSPHRIRHHERYEEFMFW